MPNLDLKYITDENGNRVLPITHVNAVRDDNGNTLTSLMSPENLGNGIGTCSTSSGTALTVSLSGYSLVQNGFVAVTFANDVPANATLNINGKGAKPIYYKGAAINANTIKAGDTAMFSYDGTNYVLCSSGAGGSATDITYDSANKKITKTVNGVTSDVVTAAKIVEDGLNPKETVKISLTQVGGNAADLIGATVIVKDYNTSEVIYSGTWNGSIITIQVNNIVHYTVSVGSITGYLDCPDQSYYAVFGERTIEFKYRGNGMYIEATDGTLYTSSNWDSSKTVNSFVLISTNYKFRIAAINDLPQKPVSNFAQPSSEIKGYLTECDSLAKAIADDNGVYNTNQIITYLNTKGILPSDTDYAAQYCKNFQFPNGVFGYLGSAGEANVLNTNLSALNQCRTACGLTTIVLGDKNSTGNIWTSSLGNTSGGYWRQVHLASGYLETYFATANSYKSVMPFGTYE